MAQATLAITLPEQAWIQQVSTAHPESMFRVLAAVPSSHSGFALVEVTGPDIPGVLEAMAGHDQITELSTLERGENDVTVYFETTKPLLLFSSRDSGMPIELPVEIRDGTATIEVTGTRQRLAELATQLEQFGIQYRIETIREASHDRQVLSERQLEVVVAAVDEGYYDTPRRCSLTELADHLDIAKSTCSETLHRAEETVVKQFVDDLSGVDETAAPQEPITPQ
ncbi:helix-turn-helix domain-containing protein [Halostagnicola kamekurae]|uniref:HTH DNA binding domain-containing protein n=1 Tax=Halostagnicola kamekurae TaxID=619731 RepID=A0A1I6QWG0_9EURY|nr:helix-turn-helix domain-containing protein [Halostagnicola kamekurae]SFS56754.1 HTH DNA binding domain-containing protein [Halostagnicola kamekurae]